MTRPIEVVFRRSAFSFALLSVLILTPTANQAQEPLPQGEIAPNEEPSSYATLMDRTDLGNIAQTARMQLDSGLRELKQAEQLRDKAAEITDPKKRQKADAKTLKAAQRADKFFREALGYNANLIEAYGGLGTALRLQGKPEEALQVHALALRRDPDDLDNFQGWTETLLELNMLGNATKAYSSYAHSNPKRAAILMNEIKRWLAEKETDPGDLDPEDVQRLALWVQQQEQG
jgi:tetratricopeptide (TPR) repeat protein